MLMKNRNSSFGKSVPICVTIPEILVNKFDEIAIKKDLTRSKFYTNIFKKIIENNEIFEKVIE